jgi:hypothetical protein
VFLILRAAAGFLGPKPPRRSRARKCTSSRKVSVHVTAVNLLMTDGAVLITGRSEVVKGWRNHPDNMGRGRTGVGCHLRQIGMALQADKADIGARQHLRVRRTVRFVACLATLSPHRRMLISERSAKICVTGNTTGLVCRERTNLIRQKAAVRIVAIRAGHSALRKPVRVRPLEGRPYGGMTPCALLINRLSFPGD